ncbi:HD domain-containing protein [Hansschlegelia plantiphila]|uniref:HD domain-containing protein n=1 Tax=Hansschlegelia plantiphila TaxID=374655 RepID=A0A9W6IYK5_9HYPH|nr:HD domain-containing protein [Hansschlegelia plantiphila]GLK67057.1 hypothetical protein GCM10008179_06950 [Hansschlegelia plantiphila]
MGSTNVVWGSGMSTIDRAIEIATEAHAGQTDKAGEPYILHPLRVAACLPEGDARIVGVLHDVIENTPWTIEQLRAEGFSEVALAGVDAVTRRDGESYRDFIVRAGHDPIGREVMIADLADNMDLSRLPEVTERDKRRLVKYRGALALLT